MIWFGMTHLSRKKLCDITFGTLQAPLWTQVRKPQNYLVGDSRSTRASSSSLPNPWTNPLEDANPDLADVVTDLVISRAEMMCSACSGCVIFPVCQISLCARIVLPTTRRGGVIVVNIE
jgi:hypothetical protein